MNVAMNLNKRFKSTAAMAMIICIMAVLFTGCSRYEVKTPVYPLLDYTMTEAGETADFVRQYTLASGGPYCDCGYKKKG